MWRFKEVRENYRPALTQSDLAQEFGVSRDTILRIEGEKAQTFHPDLLKAYSDKFNVSIEYLLGFSDTSSRDADINMICDATGLSEDAVNILRGYKEDPLAKASLGHEPAAVVNALVSSGGNKPGSKGFYQGLTDNELIQRLYDYLFVDDTGIIEMDIYFTGEDGHGKKVMKIPADAPIILRDMQDNELRFTPTVLEQIMLDRIRDALKGLRDKLRAIDKEDK